MGTDDTGRSGLLVEPKSRRVMFVTGGFAVMCLFVLLFVGGNALSQPTDSSTKQAITVTLETASAGSNAVAGVASIATVAHPQVLPRTEGMHGLEFVRDPRPGVRIGVVSMWDDAWFFRNVVHTTASNKARYCEKHGYALIVGNDLVDKSRPATWSKIPIMKKYFATGLFDWLMWVDADALFANFNTTVESFLDDKYDIIATEDYNGFHAGVFILRNSPWMMQFLDEVWEQKQFVKSSTFSMEEQGAMGHLIKTRPGYAERLKTIPHPAGRHHNDLMVYHEGYEAGDYIVHLAGKLYQRGVQGTELLATQFDAMSYLSLHHQQSFTKGRWCLSRPIGQVEPIAESHIGWFPYQFPGAEGLKDPQD